MLFEHGRYSEALILLKGQLTAGAAKLAIRPGI